MLTSRFTITPDTVLKGIGALAALAVVLYFALQLFPVFRAPEITLTAPAKDLVVADPEYTLSGTVSDHAKLTVNHEELYVDGNGHFERGMLLSLGTNTIDVTAEGRFGRTTELTRFIIYKK